MSINLNTKVKELLLKRKAAILKLQDILGDSKSGLEALDDLMEIVKPVTIDRHALTKIGECSLLAFKEHKKFPPDSRDTQAFLFACGIESFLLSHNVLPPFTIKKEDEYGS